MMIVRDVMTDAVRTVRASTPLREVAHVLIDNAISGVPVVDMDGAVVGVISEADILVKEQGAGAIPHRHSLVSSASRRPRMSSSPSCELSRPGRR